MKDFEVLEAFAERSLHWLGHDGFRLVGRNKTVVFDPFQVKDSAKADIVCITHEHFDHCSPDDVKKVQGPKTVVIAPKDCVGKLSGDVRTVAPGDKLVVDGVEIETIPAYNTNKNFHPRANGWVGYIVTLDGIRIYHSGDTDHIPEMKNLEVDIALLPVSGTYVMTAEEAAAAALEIKPRIALPMHFGSIVGQAADAERFKKLLAGKVEVVAKTRE